MKSAIYQELLNPERIDAIKIQLKPGQHISYFDSTLNSLIDAIVIQPKKIRCLVEHVKDGERWNIPLYYINLEGVDADIRPVKKQKGISKSVLKVGDIVGFKNTDSTVVRHLGRDSHYAILHNALWVNANLFQTDLCRDPESKDGMIV